MGWSVHFYNEDIPLLKFLFLYWYSVSVGGFQPQLVAFVSLISIVFKIRARNIYLLNYKFTQAKGQW